ncbi:MAG: SHOCT-like domain-containing protein [Candidatus Promineifilaceae bacterium]|jgi:hypothetical protein
MGEAESRILEMLSNGTINADEAKELLAALSTEAESETGPIGLTDSGEVQEAKPHTPPPDLSRFRRWWGIALFVAASSALISGLGLILMYQDSSSIAFFGFLCVWSIFIIALFITIILLLTRRTTWFYINVDEADGSHFTLGMPMPLGWVNWLVKVSKPFVPAEQAGYLETASAFVAAMKNDPEALPIVIDVDEEDGDKVELFIGYPS